MENCILFLKREVLAFIVEERFNGTKVTHRSVAFCSGEDYHDGEHSFKAG
jgi:hypothetical protein